MPCFLTVNCHIENLQVLKRALEDAGVKFDETGGGNIYGAINGDSWFYNASSKTLTAEQATINKIKHHYTLAEVQTAARQKGMKIKKTIAEDGSISLVLTQ